MPSAKAINAIRQAVEARRGPGKSTGFYVGAVDNEVGRVSAIYDGIDQEIGAYRRPEGTDIDLLKWTKLDMPFAKTREQLQAALAMVASQQIPWPSDDHSYQDAADATGVFGDVRDNAHGQNFAWWVMRGEDAIRRYDFQYADVPRGVQPWRVGRDLGIALRGFASVQQDVDAIAEALRGHMQSQARKLGVWMDLRVYVRSLSPEEERRKAQRERDYAARKFAADEAKKAAAEAKREQKARERVQALSERTTTEVRASMLDTGSKRKAALGPGYRKAVIERAAQRGKDLEVGAPTHPLEYRPPEPRTGIETEVVLGELEDMVRPTGYKSDDYERGIVERARMIETTDPAAYGGHGSPPTSRQDEIAQRAAMIELNNPYRCVRRR